jgi:hypothetical protein
MSRPLKFKLGRKCLVLFNYYGHPFDSGDVVTIVAHNGSDYKVTNGLEEGWLDISELMTL